MLTEPCSAVQVITKLLYLLTQGETLTKACSSAILYFAMPYALLTSYHWQHCKPYHFLPNSGFGALSAMQASTYTVKLAMQSPISCKLAAQKEASEVFFSVTKLYQSKDANLRRMVYLVIKDVCPGSDEVIIITSSLMKDMNSKTDLYRSNAIRVLCSITDSQLLGQIERYLKQVNTCMWHLVSSLCAALFGWLN